MSPRLPRRSDVIDSTAQHFHVDINTTEPIKSPLVHSETPQSPSMQEDSRIAPVSSEQSSPPQPIKLDPAPSASPRPVPRPRPTVPSVQPASASTNTEVCGWMDVICSLLLTTFAEQPVVVKNRVIAVYTCVPDEDDELAFKV